jgi:transposase
MAIAARLGISVDTARKWRRRFAAEGLEGLKDRPDLAGHARSRRSW